MAEKPVQILPSLKDCIYTAQYCEENIWHLCDFVRINHTEQLQKCYVVFVSNANRTVPLWRQRCGHSEDKIVLWDYHVIFLYQPDERCLVYDMDTLLPFPTYFHKYVTETFRTDHILHVQHHRHFRVVPATVFLETFASDRSHMLNSDGGWVSEPPSYPAIRTPANCSNLQQFISMEMSPSTPGDVYSLTKFVTRFYNTEVTI